MNNKLKFLVALTKATLVGVAILIILTIVSLFILNAIFDIIFPPEPLALGGGFGRVASFERGLIVLYIINAGIASFISGYCVRRWGREISLYVWQSVISGFIISSIPALLFVVLFPVPNRALFLREVLNTFYFGVFGALIGLLGYYAEEYRYRRRASQ